MSALDYLKELQSKFPPESMQNWNQGISPEICERRLELAGRVGYRAELEKMYSQFTFEWQEQTFKEDVVNPFLSCLPMETRRALENVAFGFLPTWNPNAWALRTPQGEMLVVLHAGLLATFRFNAELGIALSQMVSQNNMEAASKLYEEGMAALCKSFEPGGGSFPVLPVEHTLESLYGDASQGCGGRTLCNRP